MVKNGKDNKLIFEKTGYYVSAKRFLSQNSLRYIESRILNYEMKKMSYLRKIKIPTLIIFAENDDFLIKPLEFYINKLKKEIKASFVKIKVFKGATHSFDNKWEEVMKEILNFVIHYFDAK